MCLGACASTSVVLASVFASHPDPFLHCFVTCTSSCQRISFGCECHPYFTVSSHMVTLGQWAIFRPSSTIISSNMVIHCCMKTR
jgi:hypothetical protein